MSRRARGALAALAVLAAATLSAGGAAAAPDAYGPRNGAALNFFSLFGPGVAVEYERYLPRYVSVASGLGFRATGGDSYTTFTLNPSLELRVWILGRAPWSELGARAMVGPFVSLREDVGFSSVHDDVLDRLAGTSVEISETASLGYRLTVWRLSFTSTLGFAVTTQLDPSGRLAPLTYPAVKLGIFLGALF